MLTRPSGLCGRSPNRPGEAGTPPGYPDVVRKGPRTTGPQRTRLPGIEGLRALAAASVLLYHVWRFAAPDGRPADLGGATWAMPHLWHGVTLFFVLSGFLLYRPVAAAALRGSRRPTVRRYLRNRALRILPAYWVVLLLTAFVLQAALVPGSGGARTEGVLDAELLVLNLLFLQNYSAQTIFTGIGPAWSLAVEAVFYALLPLLALLAMWLVARGRRARGALLAPVVLLLLVGASGKLAAIAVVDWQLGVVRSFWGLADLFALGMLVAIVAVEAEDGRLTLPARWRAGAWALLAGVVALALALGTSNLEPRATTTHLYNVAAGVACAVLLALVVIPRPGAPAVLVRALEHRFLIGAGLASYSVFLWHEPLLHWLRVRGATAHGADGFLLNAALIGLATALLAVLTYRLVEVPSLRLKGGRPGEQAQPPRQEGTPEPSLGTEPGARTVPREQAQAAP
jgi:peptidoglycan/LPS O-acetylase OafA/YrhL